ncbi:MAG: MFS transporter [Hyphomicrobiaceae bacterium]|nr:MFS transporter [Hyphomicrobiaceae bacterium]
MTTTTATSAHDAAGFRRNVPLLALSQALFMTVQSMGTVTLPLAALAMLAPQWQWLATMPLFLNHAGIMALTIPASMLMARIGRRWGFTIGAVLSLSFGTLAALAVWLRSFELLCLAAFLKGSAAAFAHYYRFAAADVSPTLLKPRAISYVMAGGVAAGFVGPELAKATVDWFAPVTFMGVFVALSMVAVALGLLLQGLSIPPLTAIEKAKGGRPLAEIARQPAFITAVMSSMFGYAVMTLVMTSTPLAMVACGYVFRDTATVIQWHIIAMFLPSFFTGHLISRFGVLPIIALGAVIELGCAIVNLAGIDFWNFLIANVLVGLGWNFAYVGGTTLLTRTYEPVERAKVQAAHDFTVYATTATAALTSGIMHAKAGWTVINVMTLPLMLSIVLAVVWLAARQRDVTQRAQQT